MIVLAEVLRVGEHGLEELQRNDFHSLIVDGVDAGHAYVLNHAEMCKVFLAECHPEARTLYGGEVQHQALQLLVVEQIALARAYVGVGEALVYFQRAGGHPLAVLPVAAVLGYLADVYLGVEVGGECFAVVAGVAVNDVEVFHLLEIVLGGVGGEYGRHSGVKAAAQYSGEAGVLEALAVGPLP